MLFHQIQYQSCPQKVLYFDSSFFYPNPFLLNWKAFLMLTFGMMFFFVFFLLNANFVTLFKSMSQGSTNIFFKQSQLNDQ